MWTLVAWPLCSVNTVYMWSVISHHVQSLQRQTSYPGSVVHAHSARCWGQPQVGRTPGQMLPAEEAHPHMVWPYKGRVVDQALSQIRAFATVHIHGLQSQGKLCSIFIFGLPDVLCSNQGCGAGTRAVLDGWSRSQNFFSGAGNLVPVQASYTNNAMFFLFFGPNRSRAGAKDLKMLEPETKKLDARSLKFEYRLHSPGFNPLRACAMLCIRACFWLTSCVFFFDVHKWECTHR